MALLPESVVVGWTGTNGTIPSGWEQWSTGEDRYLKMVDDLGDTVGATGGSATHTHGVGTHTHSSASTHNHNFSAGLSVKTGDTVSLGGIIAQSAQSQSTHSHASKTHLNATATWGASTDNLTAAGDDPVHTTVIWITPSSPGEFDVPDGAIAWTDSSDFGSLNPSWTLQDTVSGDNLDLDDDWLLGAANGANGGGSGGSATHTHAAANHDHPSLSHTHASYAASNSSASMNYIGGLMVPPQGMYLNHHNVSLLGSTTGNTDNTSIGFDSGTNEWEHTKLLCYRNETGGEESPSGIIVAWRGAVASIPSGWTPCDGSGGTPDILGRSIKMTTTAVEAGDQDGSNTHSHQDADSHSHTNTGSSHNHSTSVTRTNTNVPQSGAVSAPFLKHTHAWTITTSTTGDTDSKSGADVESTAEDGRQPYVDIVFIKKVSPTVHVKGKVDALGDTQIK